MLLRRPAPALRALATVYFFTATDAYFVDHVFPDAGNIRFLLDGDWTVDTRAGRVRVPPGGTLFGPTERWTGISGTAGRGAGILLTPLGWDRLVRRPAYLLADRSAPLGDLLPMRGEAVTAALQEAGDDWDGLGAELFDRLLAARLADVPPADGAVARVAAALDGRPPDAAAFAAAAGMTAPALRACCKRAFGFNPKRLLRRQRFLGMLERLRAEGGGRLSALRDESYTDQPHFNREFLEFAGLPPRRYLAMDRPLLDQLGRAGRAAGLLPEDMPWPLGAQLLGAQPAPPSSASTHSGTSRPAGPALDSSNRSLPPDASRFSSSVAAPAAAATETKPAAG